MIATLTDFQAGRRSLAMQHERWNDSRQMLTLAEALLAMYYAGVITDTQHARLVQESR